ncbi:hypothetical protein RRG08_019326 [Elysia crispata]|uniref:Uncharacterized protein n=1 Tax=Elysia crispata TaxID=231223 RepID=A0AAE1E1B3_9GAST|nr:hypothetical protein RRG08_019326 [Elysia crispata]
MFLLARRDGAKAAALYIVCCMPCAVCRMLCAVCCMSYAVCRVLYVVCCMPYAVCRVLYVVCCVPCTVYRMLYAVCCMSYAVCRVLYAVCCMSYAVCQMLHAALHNCSFTRPQNVYGLRLGQDIFVAVRFNFDKRCRYLRHPINRQREADIKS